MMQHQSAPLVKRPRAAVACNGCRQTKSKCDSARPVCGRCAARNVECVYTQTVWDKRLERQEDRRALLALRNRVAELEARLATVSTSGGQPGSSGQSGQPYDPSSNPSMPSDQGRSPFQKDTPGGVSEAESQETNPESAADILATGAFDRQPVADIGYFGPSSNHAVFRFISTVITNSRVDGTHIYQDASTSSPLTEKGEFPPRTPGSDAAAAAMKRLEQVFPDPKTCVEWISRFFDTVGAVLPYVSEAPLLREVNKLGVSLGYDTPQSRPTKALLYVVFAHALSSVDLTAAEPFYHKALGLLLINEQTVGSWNLETIQALLLLGSYQQNTQRAMTSLSSHSLAVKVSYQLGLHSPSSYEHLGAQEKDLRVKIWFAVINQDRMLGVSLGRPCLIPPQYVRIEVPDIIAPKLPSGAVRTSSALKSSIYFSQLISLHETIGVALDSIYVSNLELHTPVPPRDIVTKALELIDLLENQRHQNDHFLTPNMKSDLETWTLEKFQSESHAVVLSLYYDRTVMIVSAIVLMTVLEQASNDSSNDLPPGIMLDSAVSVLRRDLEAVKEFQRVLSAVLRQARVFLRSSASWWVCNFTALTISLHAFAFWLISLHSTTFPAAIGFTTAEAENLVLGCLDALKTVGGSSLLSAKAHQCLRRYFELIKTIGMEPAQQQGQGPAESGSGNAIQDDFLDFMFGSVDDVFRQLGDNEFLGADVLTMENSINHYGNAGGFPERWNQ